MIWNANGKMLPYLKVNIFAACPRRYTYPLPHTHTLSLSLSNLRSPTTKRTHYPLGHRAGLLNVELIDICIILSLLKCSHLLIDVAKYLLFISLNLNLNASPPSEMLSHVKHPLELTTYKN